MKRNPTALTILRLSWYQTDETLVTKSIGETETQSNSYKYSKSNTCEKRFFMIREQIEGSLASNESDKTDTIRITFT